MKMICLMHVHEEEFPRKSTKVLVPVDKVVRVEDLDRNYELGSDRWNRTRIVIQSGDYVDSVDVEECFDEVEQKLGAV